MEVDELTGHRMLARVREDAKDLSLLFGIKSPLVEESASYGTSPKAWQAGTFLASCGVGGRGVRQLLSGRMGSCGTQDLGA
jgi:hypothetical protein